MLKVTALTLVILTSALFLAGCVPFLYPLFTEKDKIFEEAFLGTWVESNGLNTWTFEKTDNQEYTLTFIERGQPAVFEARVGKLAGQ